MKKIKKTVNEINHIIQKELWFDFDIVSYSKFELKIIGGIDIFYPLEIDSGDIVITFSDVFYISSLMDWHTDTTKVSLRVLEGEKFYDINKKYQVTQGNYVFEFLVEDHNEGLYYIIAKNISYKITKP